jgi:2C-methyl-D-erythritol 2,4-cyclodiphosphate synthase
MEPTDKQMDDILSQIKNGDNYKKLLAEYINILKEIETYKENSKLKNIQFFIENKENELQNKKREIKTFITKEVDIELKLLDLNQRLENNYLNNL